MLANLKRGDVRAALGNLFWLASERFTQVLVAIVISGVLARYFGAEIFGKWQYANTLLNVLAPITWVCGAEILVPAMVADRAALPRIMGSAFTLRFIVSAAALLLVWVFLGWSAWGPWLPGHPDWHGIAGNVASIDPVVASMLAGLALTLLFREPFGVVSAWLQSRTYSRPALLLSISTALCKALAVYVLARAAMAPGAFGWIWAAESAAIGAGLLAYYRRHGAGWRVDGALLRHFASAGSVFWLGLICMYLFMKLDRLMLQHYVTFAELGRYAAAQQLNENWITLALMLAQTVAPAFVYRVADPALLRRNLWRLLVLTGVVMSVGAWVLTLCAPFIVTLVFGHGFDTTVGFLRAAAWLSLPAGLEAICNLVVLKYQAKYVVLVKWLAALIAAFLANLLLIPVWGGYGALLGLSIGYLVALLVDAMYISRAFKNARRAASEPLRGQP